MRSSSTEPARPAAERQPPAFAVKAPLAAPVELAGNGAGTGAETGAVQGASAAAPLVLARQKTMYGGKAIAPGDRVFLFASETAGGRGLFACGTVTAAEAVPHTPGLARQTPRVTIALRLDALALRPLGRRELKPFADWSDGRPETELNFKLYRQATDKIVGLSAATAAFLEEFF